MVDFALGVSGCRFSASSSRASSASALILAGVPGLVDSFVRFALQGLGTPAPIAPTQHLVVTGLYRYVRNPIYVAVAAVIFGQAVLFGDWRLSRLRRGLLRSSATCLSWATRSRR